MQPVETVYGICYGSGRLTNFKNTSGIDLVISRKNGSYGNLEVEVTSPYFAIYLVSPEETITYKTDKNIILNSVSNTLASNVHYTLYLAVKVKIVCRYVILPLVLDRIVSGNGK